MLKVNVQNNVHKGGDPGLVPAPATGLGTFLGGIPGPGNPRVSWWSPGLQGEAYAESLTRQDRISPGCSVRTTV